MLLVLVVLVVLVLLVLMVVPSMERCGLCSWCSLRHLVDVSCMASSLEYWHLGALALAGEGGAEGGAMVGAVEGAMVGAMVGAMEGAIVGTVGGAVVGTATSPSLRPSSTIRGGRNPSSGAGRSSPPPRTSSCTSRRSTVGRGLKWSPQWRIQGVASPTASSPGFGLNTSFLGRAAADYRWLLKNKKPRIENRRLQSRD